MREKASESVNGGRDYRDSDPFSKSGCRFLIGRGIKFTLKPQPFTLVEKESYLARYFSQSAVWNVLKAWRGNRDRFMGKSAFPKALPQILFRFIWGVQPWGLVTPGAELLVDPAAWALSSGKLRLGVAFCVSSESG